MRTLLIIGAGGLGSEVVDIVRETKRNAYAHVAFVDDFIKAGTVLHGVEVRGTRAVLREMTPGRVDLCVAVGDPVARQQLIEDIARYGHPVIDVIDPTAVIRPSAVIGPGAIVGARAVVATNASVGAHVVINIGAIVGHDVSIGPYSVIGAAAVLNGGSSIGEGVLIGAGAAVLPGRRVGSRSRVAMSAAVFTEIGEGITVLGNPARAVNILRRDGRAQRTTESPSESEVTGR
jgi:sugar O-acyltransferase (sialic acid O-acetyltransferase NeuD family)